MSAKAKTYNNTRDTLAYWGGIRPLVRRLGRPEMIERNRDAIAAELLMIGLGSVQDIMSWDEEGNVRVKATRDIPNHILKIVKKVKVTSVVEKDGRKTNTLEVELWDKLSALRVLSRAAGFLDKPEDEGNRPSVIGINMHGPDMEPKAEYTEVEDESD
jgi:hypothetical protein